MFLPLLKEAVSLSQSSKTGRGIAPLPETRETTTWTAGAGPGVAACPRRGTREPLRTLAPLPKARILAQWTEA